MAVFAGKTYTGATINLDEHSYRDCTFIDCAIIYSGKTPIGSIYTKGCIWELEGSALNTLHFLQENSVPFCKNCKDK
jgi:hypothetical protein